MPISLESVGLVGYYNTVLQGFHVKLLRTGMCPECPDANDQSHTLFSEEYMNTVCRHLICLLAIAVITGVVISETAHAEQILSRELELTGNYVNLPVTTGGVKQRMTLHIDGEMVRYIDIELSEGEPDFWASMDVRGFTGKTGELRLENAPAGTKGLDMIYQADEMRDADSFYTEKLRSQIHFSSKIGWNNDPNGLVYHDGEYHLYYQHNPYGWRWGNMHWGHAVSRDLIHWTELPDALYPDELGTMFSGSAVVDHNNTGGFQSGREKVIVAAYTANSSEVQVQCIAYSNDRGRTFTKYPGNPVVGDRRAIIGSKDNRDPKVFWHKDSGKWVMVLGEGMGLSIFTSDNIKDWKYESHVVGFWECPELFELPVNGDPNNTKWVMYGASGTYMIGSFDGRKFTLESGKHWYHKGAMYAAQTYNDTPDGRRIQIGWGRTTTPGMRFNQMMTFPSEFTLRTTTEGVRLCIEPIDEIASLHGKSHRMENAVITEDGLEAAADLGTELLHITAEFEIVTSRSFGLNVNGFEIAYEANRNLLNDAFLSPVDGRVYLEIIVDRNSVEIYANHGQAYILSAHNSVDNPRGVTMFSNGQGETLLKHIEIHELKSIWR
jgi:fructan beta-fructosidase